MEIDFLSQLDETNSIKNEETGEIILTQDKMEINKIYLIQSPCKIISNCNTIISCPLFLIGSSSVFLENISFETSIFAIDSNNLQIKKCSFKNCNEKAAILIQNSESVFLQSLTITEINMIPGIIITNKCSVKANNITIHGLMKSFIICDDNSTLNIDNSTFYHSKSNVISISNDSYLDIKNCKISDSSYPAIYMVNSICNIEENIIDNISLNGIVLINSRSFKISNNKLTNIKGSSISVFDNSEGIIQNNFISKVGSNGIYLYNHSNVNIYNNEINEIEYPGIAILLKSKAKIKENYIKNINSVGIRISNSEKVEIEQNDICDIKECGVSIADNANCIIIKNKISHCNISAVESFNQSSAFINENHFSEMKEYAFLAYTTGKINAENNFIDNVGKSMVNLNYGGSGNFVNNEIKNCPNQMEGQTSSLYYFEGNGNFSAITNDETKTNDSCILEEKISLNSKMCIKCNKMERNCYLLNCGHKVYCDECANEAIQKNEKCPLCRFPITRFTKGLILNDGICQICYDAKADCIVLPCLQICACQSCLSRWLKENKSCPCCQIEPVSIKIIQDI